MRRGPAHVVGVAMVKALVGRRAVPLQSATGVAVGHEMHSTVVWSSSVQPAPSCQSGMQPTAGVAVNIS